jgi:hypothetical protein
MASFERAPRTGEGGTALAHSKLPLELRRAEKKAKVADFLHKVAAQIKGKRLTVRLPRGGARSRRDTKKRRGMSRRRR